MRDNFYKYVTLEKLFILSISISMAMLPWHINVSNGALIGSAVLALVLFIRDRRYILSLALLPAIFFLLQVISLTYSEDLRAGLREFELQICFLIVPLIFLVAAPYLTDRSVTLILQVFFTSTMLFCVIAYCRIVVTTGYLFPINDEAPFTYFAPFSRYAFTSLNGIHPTYLSMYLLFASVILVYKFHINSWFKIILMFLIGLFLYILSSKNQLVTFGCIIIMLIYLTIKVPTLLKVGIAIFIAGALVWVGLSSSQIRYRFNEELTTTIGERQTLWLSGWEVISSNIIMGVGIGDAQRCIDEEVTKRGSGNLNDYNLHNQFLDYWLSFGLVGLTIFLSFFIIPILVKGETALLFFLFIIGTSSLTESIFYRQQGLCFFLIAFCLMSVSYKFPLYKSSIIRA